MIISLRDQGLHLNCDRYKSCRVEFGFPVMANISFKINCAPVHKKVYKTWIEGFSVVNSSSDRSLIEHNWINWKDISKTGLLYNINVST